MSDLKWYEIMREHFGVHLTEARAQIWVQEMCLPDALKHITDFELGEVLHWVRKKREGQENRQTPTLEMLIGWVKWYRKEHARYRNGKKQYDLGELKAMMQKAGTHTERWNILCNLAPSVEAAFLLDEWAARVWGEPYRAAVDDLKTEMAQGIHEVVETRSAALSAKMRVTDEIKTPTANAEEF